MYVRTLKVGEALQIVMEGNGGRLERVLVQPRPGDRRGTVRLVVDAAPSVRLGVASEHPFELQRASAEALDNDCDDHEVVQVDDSDCDNHGIPF